MPRMTSFDGHAAEALVELLALEAPPVRAQREHRRRVGDDRRRPVDRVDLRHQRRVDRAGALSYSSWSVELRMPRVQVVADRVVLAHEQRVQEREADPEVPGDAREVDVLLELLRRQALLVDPELAVLARAERGGERRVAAVDLRAVPPVRVVGDVRRRLVRVGRSGRACVRGIFIGCSGQGSSSATGISPRLLRLGLAVAEPVVHLELDPRSGEQVERRRRLELLAGQELAADQARARVEHRVSRLAVAVNESGTLRPKRLPRLPISGSSRSLNVPSSVRAIR